MINTKKILIGLPSATGQVPTEMVQSLLQLVKPCPTAFMVVKRQRIDKARNAMALEALKQGCDYLLMVDDDNPIPPDTLVKFMEDDKDVVIAPILGRNPNKEGIHPLCAFYSEVHKVDGADLRLYKPIEKFKEEGDLHKVDGGGTGCMLIKRRVLEVMFVKYKDYMFEFGDVRFKEKIMIDSVEYERRTMSEDMEFCERVIDLGFEIWLDGRVRPYHMGATQFLQYNNLQNG